MKQINFLYKRKKYFLVHKHVVEAANYSINLKFLGRVTCTNLKSAKQIFLIINQEVFIFKKSHLANSDDYPFPSQKHVQARINLYTKQHF